MSPSSSHTTIDQVDSAERLKRVASSSAISSIGHSAHLHGHGGSMGTLPGLSYGSIYMKLWAALNHLDQDPFPEVAKMCQTVTGHIRSQVKEIQKESGDRLSASMSLPPSPNRGSYLAESPPTLHPTASDLHRMVARSAIAVRTRKFHPNTINEDHVVEVQKKVLVGTNFVPWCCKKFAQSTARGSPLKDHESTSFYEREWRYIRNNKIRVEAVEEQRRATSSRMENQVFNTRCAAPPNILQFHPYDQRIAVAARDSFGCVMYKYFWIM